MSLDLTAGVRIAAILPPPVRLKATLPDQSIGRGKVVALPGPAGAGGSGIVWTQSTPSASWTIPHGLGRLPVVAVYDNAGNEILAEVFADSTHVAVIWPSAMTGSAVLT